MTRFESFPNGLLLHIFRYLHKFDLLYAFTKLNQRFQQIIRPYLFHINLIDKNFPSYQQFRFFYDYILPENTDNIRSFTLGGHHQLPFFRMNICQFINLKSLTIKNATDSKQHAFLMKALTISSLSELSVFCAIDDILKTISSYASPNLNKLTLIYSGSERIMENVRSMPYIRQFSLNLESVKTLIDLFILMPNLEELNLSIRQFTDVDEMFQLNVPKTLKKLSIEFGNYSEYIYPPPSFEMIRKFLELFKNHLQSLTIIGINVCDKNFSNFDKLQTLVHDFIRLKKFEYYINTDQQPNPISCFPNVTQLPDLTYSIYTFPKPRPFDTISPRVTFGTELYSELTLRNLYNCQTLNLSTRSWPPTNFELKKDLLFPNLRKIDCDEPINSCSSEVLEYATKIIAQSPNLDSVNVCSWHELSKLIKLYRTLFPLATRTRIRCTDIWIDVHPNIKIIPYSKFVYEIAEIFPNTNKLSLYIEQKHLDVSYSSFIEFIDDLRRNFRKLTYLETCMSIENQKTFHGYEQDLSRLSNEKLLHYTLINRKNENIFYTFVIWL